MLYSGDRPNPQLSKFVSDHLRAPHNRVRDRYEVGPFSRPIETTKSSPTFRMHGYHLGKKPHDAVEAYIKHYTSEGDIVLDPFCGSGSTALAALIQGRKTIAIDVSPAATFITRFYVSRVDPTDLKARFENMCSAVAEEMRHLYGTVCHRCGASSTIHYVVYSNMYACPVCGRNVSLFEAQQHMPPSCPHCLKTRGEAPQIRTSLGIVGNEPVAVNFTCHGSCSPPRMTRSIIGPADDRNAFRSIDLETLTRLEAEPVPYPYPEQFMMNVDDPEAPWGDEWRPSRNFRRVCDLFTYRNLRAVAALMHAARSDDDLRAIITSGMLAVSRKAQHLSGGGGYIPGNWALPPVSKQRNVLESLRKVFARTVQAKAALARLIKSQQACISTQSALSLEAIPDCSVDYIFTDPPYGGTVQYGELNFVWEAWLGLSTSWHDDEIIVSQSRRRSATDWSAMMRTAMSECYRVLKPGRWLSLCWHDGSGGTWPVLQEMMAAVGFSVSRCDEAVSIDTGSSTYNQRVWDKAVKRDLVLNFRKPRAGEHFEPRHRQTHSGSDFAKVACEVMTAYLSKNPGAAKDRVYDNLVTCMFCQKRIQVHNFDKLLASIARQLDDGSRGWVLK